MSIFRDTFLPEHCGKDIADEMLIQTLEPNTPLQIVSGFILDLNVICTIEC